MGGQYAVGKQSTRKYSEGMNAAARYINAEPDEIGAEPPVNVVIAIVKSFHAHIICSAMQFSVHPLHS